MNAWEVVLVKEVEQWYLALPARDAALVEQAIDLLAQRGPGLGRPLVDTIVGSRLPNLKELRPASSGRKKVRILFAFDPRRRAILLVAGDKAGLWRRWYRAAIGDAERRFAQWVALIEAGRDEGE